MHIRNGVFFEGMDDFEAHSLEFAADIENFLAAGAENNFAAGNGLGAAWTAPRDAATFMF